MAGQHSARSSRPQRAPQASRRQSASLPEMRRQGAARRQAETGEAPQRAAEPAAPKRKRRYVTALDGMRALAVLAVIGYHLGLGWDKGGLLGVTMFFVLSGYLITEILVNELSDNGGIDFVGFWMRRARRLLPALLCVVAVTVILCTVFSHQLLTKMRPDIIPGILVCENWWYVLRGLSYFDAMGSPSPLVHLWSLAIEEQFYLLWPLIIFGLYKVGGNKKTLRYLCLILSVISLALMIIIFRPDADPTRVYYGTDTRAFSLLLGAWLALSFPSQRIRPRNAFSVALVKNPGILDAMGVIAVIGLLIEMIVIDGNADFMYRGGILIASMLSMALIAALVHPGTKISKVFALKPLAWLGRISYGMYLWHLPVILLLAPIDRTMGGHSWWFCLLALVIVIGVSSVQYIFLEEPIRKGAISNYIREYRKNPAHRKPIIPVTICTVVLLAAIVCATAVPDEAYVPAEAQVNTGMAVDQPADLMEEAAATVGVSGHDSGSLNPFLIGDSTSSVLDLASTYPYSYNDSYADRQTSQALDILEEYINQGVVGHVVIFDCFSSHTLRNGELERLYELVGPNRELFLVTCRTPYELTGINNEAIMAFADQRPTVHVIDWFSAVQGHEEDWLYSDGIHLTPAGASACLALISSAIDSYLPPVDKGQEG